MLCGFDDFQSYFFGGGGWAKIMIQYYSLGEMSIFPTVGSQTFCGNVDKCYFLKCMREVTKSHLNQLLVVWDYYTSYSEEAQFFCVFF